ncbi:hypothetical protein BDF14DRAFT_1782041 [Spinellus fusiger]|nr:hypothetical protein BDF14DRAFT_1782041 [Spinellus fusiger]
MEQTSRFVLHMLFSRSLLSHGHLMTRHVRPITNSTLPPNELIKWPRFKRYVDQFRGSPASYIVTFSVLHELTVLVPFPFVYYALKAYNVQIPLPKEALEGGNTAVNKIRKYYGYEPLALDNHAMVHLATSYAILKLLMPVRLMVSFAMTPFVARWCYDPLKSLVLRGVRKIRPSQRSS